MAIARRTAKTPACIDTRVPHTTRDSTSRPRSSVPNGCAQLGALRIWLQSVLTGLTMPIHGAPIASAVKSSTTPAPTSAGGRRRARRQPRRMALLDGPAAGAMRLSAMAAVPVVPSALTGRSTNANAGVQERVGGVHEEIDQDVRARRDEDDALDQRVVAREHRLHDQPAEARHHEDLLRHDRATHERAHLEAEDRDDGDQPVANR